MYSLSPHIVDDRQRELIAARAVHTPRPRRFPVGALRGVRWLGWTPRRAAA